MALPEIKVRVTGDSSGGVRAIEDVDRRLGSASRRARTYSTQINKASLSTANLAAQFNDIGVMLASGQSPLILALQQGTQVNQVLGQMGGGGVQRLRALTMGF